MQDTLLDTLYDAGSSMLFIMLEISETDSAQGYKNKYYVEDQMMD